MTKEEIKALLTEGTWSNVLKEYIVQEYGENKLVTTKRVVFFEDENNSCTESLLGVAVINNELFYFVERYCYEDEYSLNSFGVRTSYHHSKITDDVIRSFVRKLAYDTNPHIEFDFDEYRSIDEYYTDEEWFFDNEESIREVIENNGYFMEEM